VVDHKNLDGSFRRLQLQPQLFLHRCKDRRG
jgi:hypothetical protein